MEIIASVFFTVISLPHTQYHSVSFRKAEEVNTRKRSRCIGHTEEHDHIVALMTDADMPC